jgi:UMF1 family MFS transporter
VELVRFCPAHGRLYLSKTSDLAPQMAGSFIPITLEQLARERGFLLSDKTTPCSANLGVGSNNGTSTPAALLLRAPDRGQCVVYILGMEINTASFAMYTFSLSVLIQALIIISMSGAADHGRYRPWM